MYTTLGLALGGGEGQASCICNAPVPGPVCPNVGAGPFGGAAGVTAGEEGRGSGARSMTLSVYNMPIKKCRH